MPDDTTDNTSHQAAPEAISFDSPSELFKHRFIMVMSDMGENVHKDSETLFLIGSLAGALVEKAKKATWAKTKAALSPKAYDQLLNSFRDRANQLAAQGNTKAAYAAEILALSLIAPHMRDDEHIASGNDLLDNMIQDTIRFYRQQTGAKKN